MGTKNAFTVTLLTGEEKEEIRFTIAEALEAMAWELKSLNLEPQNWLEKSTGHTGGSLKDDFEKALDSDHYIRSEVANLIKAWRKAGSPPPPIT